MNRLLFSLFVVSCCSLSAHAQSSPWRMDFHLGRTSYVGDIADHPFHVQNWKPVVGLGLQYQLNTHFSLKSNLSHGRLSGNDLYFTNTHWPSGDRLARFTTSFTHWSSMLEYHFLESSKLGRFRKWSPYIAMGGGLVFYDPKPNVEITRNPDLVLAIENDANAEYAKSALSLDLEIGLDWRVFDRWSIGIQMAIHPMTTDYLDGISEAGNPNDSDWYGQGGIRLQYHFVPEPDSDSDGVADEIDACPNRPGLAEMQGCPDSDRDGFHDLKDLCPSQPGSISLGGCPDWDGDGIADKDDLCPKTFGPFSRGGCPLEDQDGDGIEDRYDACPEVPGPLEREGCPIVDSDQDGILDEDDRCPYAYGLSIFFGCPDTDGDGIENSRDACPTLFGVYTHNGCPEIIYPEEEAAEINKQVLLFNRGSADIPRYGLLDQIVRFLKANSTYKLTISGFTDSEGNSLNHQQLSSARARACYRYLRQQGIPEFKMRYQGLGVRPLSAQELQTKGQALSRRVEFLLYK